MIQDIAPLRLENQYIPRKPGEWDKIIAFRGDALYLAGGEGVIRYPTHRELIRHMGTGGSPQLQYLFSIGDCAYYLAVEHELHIPGFGYHRMFDLRAMGPKAEVLAGATAWHLYTWYRDNRYCGACGRPLAPDAGLRMLGCAACGNMVFPRISPAVIVGVIDGSRLLMTKYRDREYKRYALIAGFVEIGETAEEAVIREVREEVGLAVDRVTYYKSQPWGFDGNLLLGYFARLAHPGKIALDESELSVAQWLDRADIPPSHEELSLTWEMIQHFKDGGIT